MRVFKFLSLTGQHCDFVFNMIKKGEIYFSPPKDCNDPFEYRCIYNSANTPLKKKVEYWKGHQIENAKYLDSLTDEKKEEYIKQIEGQLIPMPEIVYHNKTQGIFCTCKIWDNLVLWGYYAHNHTGIAVEFETAGVEILSRPYVVKYSNEIPTINPYVGVPHEELIQILSTKVEDWKHEKEIRFFCGTGTHQINNTAIKSITFGLRTPETHPDIFYDLIKLMRTTLPEAKIYIVDRNHSRRKFGLLRKEI